MNIGIIGTGDISKEMIKSAYELNLNVVSVYSRKLETAQNFANIYHVKNAFHTLDEFLDSPIDIIYIGVPNSLHYAYAKSCLEKGKHVLLEKPLVLKYEQYEELLKIASFNNVMILEVDRVNYLPNYQKIKEYMDDSNKLIQIEYCKQSRRYKDYCKGELPHIFDCKYGGGALYDLGVYGLHFIVGLLGEPENLTYECHLGKGKVDMFGILTLSYPDTLANIILSKITQGRSCLYIQSEHVSISSDSPPSRLHQLTIRKDGKTAYFNDEIDNFIHYLKHAMDIIETNNLLEYQSQTKKSKMVLKLLETARKKGGITFENGD